MIESRTLQELENKLRDRRREVLDYRTDIRSRWQTLNEPEKEPEESASKENLSRGLEQLDHNSRQEVQQIDDALIRMEQGRYGECTACGEPISKMRLYAVPWTGLCRMCTQQREAFSSRAALTLSEQIEEGELDEDEICAALRDEFSRSEAVNGDAVKIDYRQETIFLSGSVPNERQHHMILEIVHEELGIDDVVDQIEIDEDAWGSTSRVDRESGLSAADKESAMYGDPAENDPYAGGGEPMMPPDRLEPEDQP